MCRRRLRHKRVMKIYVVVHNVLSKRNKRLKKEWNGNSKVNQRILYLSVCLYLENWIPSHSKSSIIKQNTLFFAFFCLERNKAVGRAKRGS